MDLYKNGLLIQDKVEQLWDPVTKRYLADRFVTGECPICGYKDARGDQCDLCGKLLNPMELINPKSALSAATPEKKQSEHLFLDLTKLQQQLDDWVTPSMEKGKWTEIARTITKAWLTEGLKPRCITRDLKWGTPVPLEQFKEKVFYVWFDAPIGYISITACLTPEWEKWWKNPEQVECVQFMGKDNVPFHSIIFPASLIGTGQNWTKVNSLSSTEYLNYESGKFSKSRGIGVFGDHAKETGIPSEIWRYYLLTNRPEQADTIFSWTDFQAKNNNELLKNLGNFCNRILKFLNNNYASKVPQAEATYSDKDNQFIAIVNNHVKEYLAAFEQVKLKDALRTTMNISHAGNLYLQDNAPWELIKKDVARCGTVVYIATQVVFLLAVLMEPFMPAFSAKVYNQLNHVTPAGQENVIHDTLQFAIPVDHIIGTAEPLFAQLSDALIKDLQKKYAGPEKFQLDLKVGEIAAAEDLGDVYKLQVSMLKNVKKQIVAGIKTSYPNPQDLIGKKVVVVCNLKHAKRKGVNSEGMLLTVKKTDGEIVLLAPQDASVPIGSVIVPEGLELDSSQILAGKSLENVLKDLTTNQNSEVTFKGKVLKIVNVSIASEKPVGGSEKVC